MKLPVNLDARRKLTPEQIDQVVELLRQGVSKSYIAEQFDVARSLIYHYYYKFFDPKKYRQMIVRSMGHNAIAKRKVSKETTRLYVKKLRSVYGRNAVSKEKQKIKDACIKKNPEKYRKWQREYREKNKEKINANWTKNRRRKLVENKSI